MAQANNTQAVELQKMLGQIANMKVTPDADLPFLTNLETVVLGYLRAPFEKQQQQQISNVGGTPNPGAPGGMAPPVVGPGAVLAPPPQVGGMMPGGAAPGRVPGIINHQGLPPADELRRILSAG